MHTLVYDVGNFSYIATGGECYSSIHSQLHLLRVRFWFIPGDVMKPLSYNAESPKAPED